MKTYRRILSVLAVLALILSSAFVAFAQDQPYQDQPFYDADPPSRAPRLQFMHGSVSLQPHGNDGLVAGAINRPLHNSANVLAVKNSRAEINAGASLVRIYSVSSLTFTNVS